MVAAGAATTREISQNRLFLPYRKWIVSVKITAQDRQSDPSRTRFVMGPMFSDNASGGVIAVLRQRARVDAHDRFLYGGGKPFCRTPDYEAPGSLGRPVRRPLGGKRRIGDNRGARECETKEERTWAM